MIKELITSAVVATTLNTINLTNSARDNTNIINNNTTIQSILYDSGGNIQQAEYYQVKEFENDLDLQYATVKAKGYQYLEVDVPLERLNWYTDYYFYISYNDGTQNDFTWNQLYISLSGYLQPNSQLGVYYEEYRIYESETDNATINTFINTETYDYTMLTNVEQTQLTEISTNDTVEAYDTTAKIIVPTKNYKIIKWRVEWECDEIWDDNNNTMNTTIIPNMLQTLAPVYTSATAFYEWSFTTDQNYEAIDIPGLAFTIIGMPFAWISTAFNLTIFPGTPYQVNFSSLFLGLIGILIFVFILRKLLK